MANTCTTTYKVTGSRKAVNDLWNVLQKMEVNSKNVWLYQLAEQYGIDYEKKGISIRGHIYWADFEADEGNDNYLLSFETESAWCACTELFEEINHTLHDELSISYRETECGCDIYYVHDEAIISRKNAVCLHQANLSRTFAKMFTPPSPMQSMSGVRKPASSRASVPLRR